MPIDCITLNIHCSLDFKVKGLQLKENPGPTPLLGNNIDIPTSLDPLNIMLGQSSCLHLTMESFDFWTNLLAFIAQLVKRVNGV